MNLRVLSSDEWSKLLGFIGYGNPAGSFWFLGMEERGLADEGHEFEEVSWRLAFEPIEDLFEAHERWSDYGTPPVDMRSYVPTWATMCKIVLRLSGDPHWRDLPRFASTKPHDSDGVEARLF